MKLLKKFHQNWRRLKSDHIGIEIQLLSVMKYQNGILKSDHIGIEIYHIY